MCGPGFPSTSVLPDRQILSNQHNLHRLHWQWYAIYHMPVSFFFSGSLRRLTCVCFLPPSSFVFLCVHECETKQTSRHRLFRRSHESVSSCLSCWFVCLSLIVLFLFLILRCFVSENKRLVLSGSHNQNCLYRIRSILPRRIISGFVRLARFCVIASLSD